MEGRSKVIDVSFADAHLSMTSTTAGIKRSAGNSSVSDNRGGEKKTRYTVSDLLPEDEQGKLKWRGDPKDTHSDWTIEVVFEGEVMAAAAAPAVAAATDMTGIADMTGVTTAAAATKEVIEIKTQVVTYHVHRFLLGFGTRRSEYFAKLFKDARADSDLGLNIDTAAVHKTTIELEPLAAKAFPDLLDFVYDPRSPLVIDTETSTATHHLGIKFEMKHLQHYAKKFIETDLTLDTLPTYYQHAKLFNDQPIWELIVEFVGKNIAAISGTSALTTTAMTTTTTAGTVTTNSGNNDSSFVAQTDVQLWKSALQHVTPNPNNYTADLHISKLVSQFAVAHKDTLDATTLQDLTTETKLRKVDPGVAWTLCALDDEVTASSAPFAAAAADGTAAGTAPTELSSLQQRCATAISENWKNLDVASLGEQIKTRKTAFLVDLLAKCLSEAKAENESYAAMSSAPTAAGASVGGASTKRTPASRSAGRRR